MATHFLPGESHGQRSLMGYGPWGHKEADTTEQISTHIYTAMLNIFRKYEQILHQILCTYIHIYGEGTHSCLENPMDREA